MGKGSAQECMAGSPVVVLGALTIAPTHTRQEFKICVKFSPENRSEANRELSSLMSALVDHAKIAKVLRHCTPTDSDDDPMATGADIFIVSFINQQAYDDFVEQLRQSLSA